MHEIYGEGNRERMYYAVFQRIVGTKNQKHSIPIYGYLRYHTIAGKLPASVYSAVW